MTQNYTEKCDVWSCGVILYILLSGTPPFPGKDDKDILRKVKVGKYNFDDAVWLNVSEDAKRFIKRMMEVDPNKRYSAQDALDDSWFTKVLEKTKVDQPLALQNLKNLKNFGVRGFCKGKQFNEKNSLNQNYKKQHGCFWCHISQQRKRKRNCWKPLELSIWTMMAN